jgi:hypothetical protein
MKDEGRWTMNYTVRLDQSSEQVTTRLMDALQQQGLQVTVSFDLRLARAGQIHCDCPYHGQAECTCQYAILLVYDPAQEDGTYRTMTLHGRDETVWLTLLQSPVPHPGNTIAHEAVEAIIVDALLSLVAPVQAVEPAEMEAMVDLEL